MALKWDDIKDALTRNDTEKIAEYKQSLAKHMDDKAIQSYLSRHSIQSIVAASWGDVLLALQSDCNNLVAKFKLELLTEFASKHGLTAYTDASLIQPGDTVVTTWKHKKKTNISHFRILGRAESQWLVSLSMWEHDASQFEAHERKEIINNKNFVVGVRQQSPPIMRKPHKFYFINFND